MTEKKKYAIWWNVGYGDEVEIIEAESAEAASKEAYEAWRMNAEEVANYGVKEAPEDVQYAECSNGEVDFFDEEHNRINPNPTPSRPTRRAPRHRQGHSGTGGAFYSRSEKMSPADIPIHAHHKTPIAENSRTVTKKDGLYAVDEVCTISVDHGYRSKREIDRAESLAKELAGVICEYLESKRERDE